MSVTHIIRNGVLYETTKAPPKANAAPHVISDTMDAIVHPAIGKKMDSKSAFRRVTRAHGCVELGNERVDTRKPETPEHVYRDAVEQAMATPRSEEQIARAHQAIERARYDFENGKRRPEWMNS